MKTSKAQHAFDNLSDYSKLLLLGQVFEVLEYRPDGTPGAEWSSDTTQALGELFNQSGVTFTDPDSPPNIIN